MEDPCRGTQPFATPAECLHERVDQFAAGDDDRLEPAAGAIEVAHQHQRRRGPERKQLLAGGGRVGKPIESECLIEPEQGVIRRAERALRTEARARSESWLRILGRRVDRRIGRMTAEQRRLHVLRPCMLRPCMLRPRMLRPRMLRPRMPRTACRRMARSGWPARRAGARAAVGRAALCPPLRRTRIAVV